MPIGVQMAQGVHAAFAFSQAHPHSVIDWHRHSQYLVVVSVADGYELVSLGIEAARRKIRSTWWQEPDMNDELTALAFEPTLASSKLCANLPLAGRAVSQEPLTQAG